MIFLDQSYITDEGWIISLMQKTSQKKLARDKPLGTFIIKNCRSVMIGNFTDCIVSQCFYRSVTFTVLNKHTNLLHNQYHILSSIMPVQVQCAPEFHNNFCQKNLILIFKDNLTRISHCRFIYHISHLKPFLSYLPCIVHREYFSIIFQVESAHYTRLNTVH